MKFNKKEKKLLRAAFLAGFGFCMDGENDVEKAVKDWEKNLKETTGEVWHERKEWGDKE